MSARMPVVFVPHGGGPWPFVEMGFPPHDVAPLADYLRSVHDVPRLPPRALLVSPAHWEAPVPTVMTSEHPPMLYDYYGFPPESYTLTWPRPGDPSLASRVRALLGDAGIATAADATRGYDHGTFVPLMLTYPDATCRRCSCRSGGLDPPNTSRSAGAAAAARRGRLHRGERHDVPQPARVSRPARGAGVGGVRWLAAREPRARRSRRNDRLAHWTAAPAARAAHPREEHLIPLMVAAGAAGEDRAVVAFNDTFTGLRLSAYHFGAVWARGA
jgi:aromatic ring-opening dioxygenase catalytic subunit (LigB family)